MQSSHRKRPRRLSATFVRTINLPGRYGDGYGGHGLSLLVKLAAHGGVSKSWAQAIRPNGRTTSIGLGAYPVVTLAAAREKALDNARAVAGGRDPPPPHPARAHLRLRGRRLSAGIGGRSARIS